MTVHGLGQGTGNQENGIQVGDQKAGNQREGTRAGDQRVENQGGPGAGRIGIVIREATRGMTRLEGPLWRMAGG